MAISGEDLSFIINHVILPPRLPQEDDSNTWYGSQALLRLVHEQIISFIERSPSQDANLWRPAVKMFGLWRECLGQNGAINTKLVQDALSQLKPGDAMAFYLKEQNAGVILQQTTEVHTRFSAFESSPTNEQVMEPKGRLVRQFPGRCVEIETAKLLESDLSHHIARSLHQLDSETVEECMATSTKARSTVIEVRETNSPEFVTDFFMSVLAAIGQPVAIEPLYKHTRDEVLWDDSLKPWRRSPFWLVMRVTLQITLAQIFPNNSRLQYKNFMVYLISRIAMIATEKGISLENRYIISAKLARRASKLDTGTFGFVADSAFVAVGAIHAALNSAWEQTRMSEKVAIPSFPRKATTRDISQSLSHCQDFLRKAMERNHKGSEPTPFIPQHIPRIQYGRNDLPYLIEQNPQDALLRLADIEAWVGLYLQGWVERTLANDETCTSLATLINSYIDLGCTTYRANPREMSVMLLTVTELWVALDKLCVQLYPLLSGFSSEIPSTLLEPLLLPKLGEMERLRTIEAYLRQRDSAPTPGTPSIFSDPQPQSFATRYYDSSQKMQNLRADIEMEAQKQRKRKKKEWNSKNSEYQSLMQEAAELTCTYNTDENDWDLHEAANCRKCICESRANNIYIHQDEWPLPVDEAHLQTVLFELDCPKGFVVWRDLTWRIIQNLGWGNSTAKSGKKLEQLLLEYDLLRGYGTYKGQNLTLGSTTKSYLKSHYKAYKMPIPLDSVCVNNALRYQLRDVSGFTWVLKGNRAPSFASHCVTPLPKGPYSNLQYAVNSYLHPPNRIIAEQGTCPKDLSLQEFLAFGSLRASGVRLSWYNILRELGSTNLSFNTEAVQTLVLQAAWQAGASEGHYERRATHATLLNVDFCQKLLEMLERLLGSIEANWKEQYSMSIVVFITLRILSLAPEQSIKDRALILLQRTREVTLRWCEDLALRLQDLIDDNAIEKTRQLIVKAASTCLATYDVDIQHVDNVLQSNGNLANLVRSLILIHDNTTNGVNILTGDLERILIHNQKIAHFLEAPLHQHIEGDNDAEMNDAISTVCSGLVLAAPWEFLPEPNQRWAVNCTAETAGRSSQKVHLNILTGRFLVNGQPLGRVSQDYSGHELYKRVFGSVHLGLRNGQELLIRTIVNGEVLEIIPHQHFEGDFPSSFVDGIVHWMNLRTGLLEFRPLPSLWTTSAGNWRLHFREQASSTMKLERRQLLDFQSDISNRLLAILGVLDDRANMHVTLDDNRIIHVELPRLKLRFFVNSDGNLESKELSAVVDMDQDLGLFYGLKNKLVLRKQDSRSVLIPFGSVIIQKAASHTSIRVDTGNASKVQHFHYHVDPHIGKLRGPTGRLGLLYKAYLHAVTASVLADPFTGRSGTEEALSNLREASLYSFSCIGTDEFRVLGWLSELTPIRQFYPQHLRTMQQVKWNENLDVLVQNDEFHIHAQAIVSHAARFSFLQDNAVTPSFLEDRGDAHLLDRARARNSIFRSYDLSSHETIDQTDLVHTARDCGPISTRAQSVHEVIKLIERWPHSLEVEYNLATVVTSWGYVSGYQQQNEWDAPYRDLIGLSFPMSWGWLYDLCRSSDRNMDSYRLMFLFGPITFGHTNSMRLIRSLLAFAFSDSFAHMSAPPAHSFDLQRGSAPHLGSIKAAIGNKCRPFNEKPPGQPRNRTESPDQRRQRYGEYQRSLQSQIDQFANKLADQWPIRTPTLPPNLRNPLIIVEGALTACKGLFQVWYSNKLYNAHIKEVSAQLAMMHCEQTELPLLYEPLFASSVHISTTSRAVPSLLDLLKSSSPAVLQSAPAGLIARKEIIPSQSEAGYTELDGIVEKLKTHPDITHQDYANDLNKSLTALKVGSVTQASQGFAFSVTELKDHSKRLRLHVSGLLAELKRFLSPTSITSRMLYTANLWPRLTPHTLLSLICSTNNQQLSANWRKCLIAYGEAITLLQRSERLIRLSIRRDLVGFQKEIESPGREGWSSEEYPDWLLIELENDLSIRPLQARVAAEMISPSTGNSSVLQLNMGEGKSSVIIPMVAAALADQRRLVRIVVLKPLLPQTNYLLSQRLGGLVSRRIYHTPFSRQTKLSTTVIATLRSIYEECKTERGLLLALPEHILSFRLMGRERLSFPADRSLAKSLMETEQWLHNNCRNILDESDEILDTRFQLVYTVGSQKLLDGQPDRWNIPQDVLSRVEKHATTLQIRYPDGLELERKGSSFPFIRFLRQELADELLSLIIRDLGEGYIRGVSFDHCSRYAQAAALRFIENRAISDEDLRLVTETFKDSTLMGKILLLRGLFAHNVLRFALQKKRWLVEYGLTDRCLMAVPYKAKGVPAISAEFGHPEVAILLTCLSYYYTGLDSKQLRHCFDLLFKEVDPSYEYKRWCAKCEALPAKLCSLNGVNMEDDNLWTNEITPRFKYSKGVIDYYMSNIVFPREGKEFMKKLSTSSWDIPASSEAGPTTGFSGTNDNRFLLPLSTAQHDLKELHDTNARVLDLLLRAENRTYMCAKDHSGRRCSVKDFLRIISQQSPRIAVLIDVGAMVLEMQNFEVAMEWLKNVPQAEAAIYFNESDELMVLDREGHIERLVASPFSHRLDCCLVYLDEVHTRGVDLNLPVNARAAVTLGPRLIKDRFVQACGRMRKLGNGQSLTFWAPPDIHHDIQDLAGEASARLDSSHVIQWALEMTCQATQQTKPLWVMQGFEHFQRTRSYSRLLGSTNDIGEAIAYEQRVSQYWNEIQEQEAQTLQTMYGVNSFHVDPRTKFSKSERDDPIVQRLSDVWDHLDTTRLQECLVHEEQEREIAHEIEREREIQRPGLMQPCEHQLHPDVTYFVDTGTFRERKGATGFQPAFEGLRNTSAMRTLGGLINNPCPELVATKDFRNTVKLRGGDDTLDDFLRPVNWVISSSKSTCLLIVSPYEANSLLPEIEVSKVACLHVYAPRTSKNMVSFANLDFYTISGNSSGKSWPTAFSLRDLNLFSGSLYFDSYTQYKVLCEFLAIMINRSRYREHPDIQLASDGFVNPIIRKLLGWSEVASPFEKSPLPFLKELLGMRGKGRDFLQTHMGDLISGSVLKKEAFE
ncbi:MAG: hypothetical protein M1835_006205 [Candelina submexicana]|nr:MAG: hypothetical protein M1835_006205 [Candelina submexicana]